MEIKSRFLFCFILTIVLSSGFLQQGHAEQGWEPLAIGTTENLFDVWGDSTDSIYISTGSGIYKFNGMSASRVVTSAPEPCIWGFTNPNTGKLSVYGGDNASIIHEFKNDSWGQINTATGNAINGLWSDEWGRIVAVGDNGMIMFTGPGRTWTAHTSGTTANLNSVWGTSMNDIYAVGDGGTILHCDNATLGTWTAMPSVTTKKLNAVWGCACVHVYAVGEGGTFLQYDYSMWRKIPSGTLQDLNGIWSPDETNIFLVGNNGTIMRYNGLWKYQFMNSGTSNSLNQIWGIEGDALNLYAVGENGTFLHLADTATTTTIPGGTTTTTINGGSTTTTTSILPISWCPFVPAADNSDQVKCLRGLRNEKIDMAIGAMLAKTYYENVQELSDILIKNRTMRLRFKMLLRSGIPTVRSLLQHGGATMTQEELFELHEFLADLQEHAGPGLQQAIGFVLQGIESGWLPDWMGIAIVE